jgi:hypothetical protein
MASGLSAAQTNADDDYGVAKSAVKSGIDKVAAKAALKAAIGVVKDVEKARFEEQSLQQISHGQLPRTKIGKPAVSNIIAKNRRTGIRDYKDIALNSRVLADTDFWYLTEYFADEMELTLKTKQLQNKIDTIPVARRPYFNTYIASLDGAGQQATVAAAQAYLRMTDDGFGHNKAFIHAMKSGENSLNENTARIHNHFSHAGVKIDEQLAEFEQAVVLQRNATKSDSQFNSVMDKGSIRDLF